MFNIVFWILAAVTISAALAVIILRDVFRAALCLVFMFLTVAGIEIKECIPLFVINVKRK